MAPKTRAILFRLILLGSAYLCVWSLCESSFRDEAGWGLDMLGCGCQDCQHLGEWGGRLMAKSPKVALKHSFQSYETLSPKP